VDGPSKKKCVVSTRGIAKSSICAKYAMKKGLLRDKRFILYVSKSLTLAEMQTENIKNDVLTNPLIRKMFGDIRTKNEPDGLEGVDDSFSKKYWSMFGEVLFLPRGIGQQVRGLLWRGRRPDLIIIDDLEDTETINNEDVRKKNKKWFM